MLKQRIERFGQSTSSVKDFKELCVKNPPAALGALSKEVETWSQKFPMPGQFLA